MNKGGSSKAVQSPINGPTGSVHDVEGNFSRNAAVPTGGNRPILKPKNCLVPPGADDAYLCIDLYPAQFLDPIIEDSDVSLPLMKYMKGNDFDLRGISDFLSSPDLDPIQQRAALQLLEHAAESQNTNFTECILVTFWPVAKLVVDSRDTLLRCAALDTLKLFLAPSDAPNTVKLMMPSGVVDAISRDLYSPDPFVQLASVELLDMASRSGEILIQFSAAISHISRALSSMQTAVKVTALRVLEVCTNSKLREPVKAVADTFHHLDEHLCSVAPTVQIAALKVLEVAAGIKDPDLARAVKAILPVVMKAQSSGETDVRNAARRVLEICAHSDQQASRVDDSADNSGVHSRFTLAMTSHPQSLHTMAQRNDYDDLSDLEPEIEFPPEPEDLIEGPLIPHFVGRGPRTNTISNHKEGKGRAKGKEVPEVAPPIVNTTVLRRMPIKPPTSLEPKKYK